MRTAGFVREQELPRLICLWQRSCGVKHEKREIMQTGEDMDLCAVEICLMPLNEPEVRTPGTRPVCSQKRSIVGCLVQWCCRLQRNVLELFQACENAHFYSARTRVALFKSQAGPVGRRRSNLSVEIEIVRTFRQGGAAM
jgi:hypothetical protein